MRPDLSLGPERKWLMVALAAAQPGRSRKEVLHFLEYATFGEAFSVDRRELFVERALLVAQRRRHAHIHMHVMIAASAAVEELHALAAQTKHLRRLRPGRNAQSFFSIERVDAHITAKGRLRHAHRLLGMNVVVATCELRVLAHRDEDVEIARRSAVVSRFSLAGDTQS